MAPLAVTTSYRSFLGSLRIHRRPGGVHAAPEVRMAKRALGQQVHRASEERLKLFGEPEEPVGQAPARVGPKGDDKIKIAPVRPPIVPRGGAEEVEAAHVILAAEHPQLVAAGFQLGVQQAVHDESSARERWITPSRSTARR